MRLSILLLFVFLLSCSSNSTEIIPPEMEESNVRVFEESANFISQDQNAGLPEDRFREIVFMDYDVELSDPLLKFSFKAQDEFFGHTLDMSLHLDPIAVEGFSPENFRIWQSSSTSGGSLWNRGGITVKLDTIELLKGGKISGTYNSPTDVRFVQGTFEVAIDTIL